MKVKISSLGCRLNQSEIQSVITMLRMNGHSITERNDADIFIINSCIVTLHSERKTRKLINSSLRALSDDKSKKIIVTGCFAESVKQEENIVYITNDYKYMIPEIIDDWDILHSIDDSFASRFGYTIPNRATKTRSNLKIQDGCDNYCTYCIIPHVRGLPVSKPFHDVINEFKKLIGAGYKEIILTGVVIGKYLDNNKKLPDLVKELLKIKGEFRLHIPSLNPELIDRELIELFSDDKMVKHVHLSLQSGSNSVLSRMNRKYTREKYQKIIDEIRSSIKLFNFTTDLIVGFPGESNDEHRDTIELVKSAGFSHIHTFRYSPRPGTAAAEMEDAVPENIKKLRSQEIIDLYQKQKILYYSNFNKKKSTLLSESFKNSNTTGFNEFYIPVIVPEKLPENTFHNIITELDEKNFRLVGEIIK